MYSERRVIYIHNGSRFCYQSASPVWVVIKKNPSTWNLYSPNVLNLVIGSRFCVVILRVLLSFRTFLQIGTSLGLCWSMQINLNDLNAITVRATVIDECRNCVLCLKLKAQLTLLLCIVHLRTWIFCQYSLDNTTCITNLPNLDLALLSILMVKVIVVVRSSFYSYLRRCVLHTIWNAAANVYK